MSDRITITPEIIEAFAAYRDMPGNDAWGSLHVVLEDGNVKQGFAESCAEWAKEKGDVEGERLAGILAEMTPSQRGRLSRKVDEWKRQVPNAQ